MKIKSIIFLLLFAITAVAQEDAWVYFKDKPNAAVFIQNPLQMLSQRSLDRRTAQNIALDEKDVPIHQPYYDEIQSAVGITIMAKSKWLNCLHIRGTITNIRSLLNYSFVASVKFANKSLNASNKLANQRANNFKSNTLSANTFFNYGVSDNQISMLNGHILHQQNFTGVGKIIAVFDSGFPGVNIAQPFERLRNNNLILGGYNYVNRNDNFYTADSHGTMVLSTMGGFVDNALVGTAPNAGYYLYITENVLSENPVEESFWVEAAEEADRMGVDIINSSLGYFDYDNPAYNHTYSDMTGNKTFISQGANIAFTRGIIVVASAGNSGGSANPHIASPADATHVLTVGAVNSQRNLASFSSVGPNFSGQVKPDVLAKGVSSTVVTTSGAISTANGTSFSSPIMAGMVASLWQALPSKTAVEIIQIIKSSSDLFATPSATCGYGIPNFATALSQNLSVNGQESDSFVVFPNPTSNTITFSLPEKKVETTLEIYNVLGQKVWSQKLLQDVHTINVENFKNGMYVYLVKSGTEQMNGKFIKN